MRTYRRIAKRLSDMGAGQWVHVRTLLAGDAAQANAGRTDNPGSGTDAGSRKIVQSRIIWIGSTGERNNGPGQFRIDHPMRELNGQAGKTGIFTDYMPGFRASTVETPDGREAQFVELPHNASAIIVHQPATLLASSAIRWLRHNRPRVSIIVDIDREPAENRADYLKQSAALADVVTVASPSLLYHGYDSDRTFVVPDGIPTEVTTNPSRPLMRTPTRKGGSGRIIGWTGDARRVADELACTSGALGTLVRDPDIRLRCVSALFDPEVELDIHRLNVEISGTVHPSLYYIALAEVDVAIVPHPFPDSVQSARRELSFAAAGVPVVATLTPANEFLRLSGMPIILVQNREEDWRKGIKSVIGLEDEELKSLASQVRRNVEMHHTTKVTVSSWLVAIRRALELRNI